MLIWAIYQDQGRETFQKAHLGQYRESAEGVGLPFGDDTRDPSTHWWIRVCAVAEETGEGRGQSRALQRAGRHHWA